jgi:hypothetical protein
VRFARILALEHAVGHEVPKGGKTLDFGETVVTVYGISGRGRRPAVQDRAPGKGRV